MDTSGLAEEHEIFGEMEEQTAAEVKAMGELYGDMRGRDTSWWRLKTACDLWTYAFFAPIQTAEPSQPHRVPTTDDIRNVLQVGNLGTQLEADALQASRDHPYFHWPLEFPDVFENGGFDVVLGNPPWGRIKLKEKEFFYGRNEAIVNAPTKAARAELIRALAISDPVLAQEFAQAKHNAESVSRFARGSNRFLLTGRGDINTYSVFTETGRYIISPTGRLGIIIPTGIATDDTTKLFFADLVETRSLVSLFDFENREKIFPGIAGSIKFCLLTVSGIGQPTTNAEFCFYLYNTEHLQDPERRFSLSAKDFALFNPNTRNCPTFRSRKDMEIARKMYRAGIFWKESKGEEPEINSWGISFQRMLDMSNNAKLFKTREQLEKEGHQLKGNIFIGDGARYLPLYEAKLFHQYDHRFATFAEVSIKERKKGNAQPITSNDKTDPYVVALPRYWIHENEVMARSSYLKPSILAESRIQNPESRIQNPESRIGADGTDDLSLLTELAYSSLSDGSRVPPTSGQASSR